MGPVFGENIPAPKVVWIKGALRQSIEQVLGHRYIGLRIRYWRSPGEQVAKVRTAWVLEEIGKELPITAGFVVAGSQIESAQVLVFRENRGSEIRYPSFTRQFQTVRLSDDHHLTGHIDGISGATLSVRAMTRLSRVALLLHQQVVLNE